MSTQKPSLTGALLGTAVGDALGLPTEGLNRVRTKRFLGDRPLDHRFFLGWGMISDDTEHAALVLQALTVSCDGCRFVRSLAWRLRWWFVGLPAGVGLATAKACLKLWAGVSPDASGVRSAGNGPCMRAVVLGAALAEDREKLIDLVDRSSRLTHRDPRAIDGGRVVAVAAAWARQGMTPKKLLNELKTVVETEDWWAKLDLIDRALEEDWTPDRFTHELDCPHGVTGFVMHSAPVALWCWLRTPDDFRATLETAISLGGDTDTVGAIAGGLAGARLGEQGIPAEWLRGVSDYPRSIEWLRRLALAVEANESPPKLNVLTLPFRNLFFLLVVLGHGFRRVVRRY